MRNLSDLVIGIGLTGAILCGTSGCASLQNMSQNMTRAQKTALVGQGLSILGEVGVSTSKKPTGAIISGIVGTTGTVIRDQALMQHDIEVANAGKDQIVINNNPPNYQNQNENNYNNFNNYNSNSNDNSTPQGLFMYKFWIDENLDKLGNRTEYKGLNEPAYDLRNLEDLKFSFSGGRAFEGVSLDLRIYDMENGRMVNFFNGTANSAALPLFKCNSELFPHSGKYRAVLNTGNNQNFSLDFDVMK